MTMLRKRRKQPRERKPRRNAWWSSLSAAGRRRLARGGAWSLLIVAVGVVLPVGMSRLDAHVQRTIAYRVTRPTVTFLAVPDEVKELAEASLWESVADVQDEPWLDADLCRRIAERVSNLAWVRRVESVRRTADGRFEVAASYRVPVAMVQHKEYFLLVDADGFRLPGTYRHDARRPLIQGVRTPAPNVGQKWEAADIAAGLAIVATMAGESFREQIAGVLVDNVAGRANAKASHIELATDRAGGRIRWGSVPGQEVEENTIAQKLAILRANYTRTGRADAHYPVIDVATFPDRFVVPG